MHVNITNKLHFHVGFWETHVQRDWKQLDVHNDNVRELQVLLLLGNQPPDDALEDWEKKLDLLCFADLYTHGIHGMHDERTPHLNPTEFVKAQLQSCHAPCFHLQHQANLHQIKVGIYHKLKVHHPWEPWAKAVAALMIIGLILLIIAFIVSLVTLCTLRLSLLRVVGLLLLIAVVLQIIALIVYPVHFNNLIFEGHYDYSWAYGFGWGATIIMLGCGILFCCLPNYEDELTGMAKTKYIYSSE
ncbi:UNVERIFIED_CONTAM: hypothetical protein FKN15_040787 [Acipenser sinensis]